MIIDKLSGSRVHFEVNVSKETFEHALDHAFEKVIQEVEIKGFRKGKAPRHIYEAKYGVKSLYEEAIQHALEDTYYHTVTENEIDVVSQPKIDLDVASVERGKDFVYQVTVAVRPEIQLGTYFDLEVKSLPIEVSDAEIEAKLTAEREKHAEMVIKKPVSWKMATPPSLIFPVRSMESCSPEELPRIMNSRSARTASSLGLRRRWSVCRLNQKKTSS
jgi:trigger factor